MHCDNCKKDIYSSYYMIKDGFVICICFDCRAKMMNEGYKEL